MTTPVLFYRSLLICEHCGESSPTRFMHELNHHIAPDGQCTTARLRQRHKEAKP